MGKAKRDRERRVVERRNIDGIVVGDVRTYETDGTEADDYSGESYSILPVVVQAATPDEASAKLDAAITAVREALEGTDGRLATKASDASGVVWSLRETLGMYEVIARQHAARQSRLN